MSRPPIIGSPRFFRLAWAIIREGIAVRRENFEVRCPAEPGRVIASWSNGAIRCTGCGAKIGESLEHEVIPLNETTEYLAAQRRHDVW